MAKQTITKEESDMLSEVLNSDGAAQERQVKTFDFVHPDKLSKANLRALELIFATLEKSWTGTLAAALRTEALVQIKPFEQATFGSYAESVPEGSLIFEVSLNPLPGKALIEMPTAIALPIVDRLAGGKGQVQGEPKPMTQIEKSIVAGFVGRLASDLASAFSPVAKLEPVVTDVHTSAAEIALAQQAPVILLTTAWDTLAMQQSVNIALPVKALDPILEDLIPQRWRKLEEGPKESASASISRLLREVEIPAKIHLGRASVSMQDVLSMEVGDVVRLETTVNDPLQIEIGGQLRFQAKPGLAGKRLAVQIVNQAEDTAHEEVPLAQAA